MKIELKKKIDAAGKTWFYIYADDKADLCFTSLEEAKLYYDNYNCEEETEILETKEI